MTPRLLLVALALADADHLETLRAVAARVRAEVAVLQGGDAPSVVRALDALAAGGRDRVRIVLFTGSGPDTGVSWVRRVAGHWVRTRGTLEVEVTALHREIRTIEDAAAGPARAVTGREAHVRISRPRS